MLTLVELFSLCCTYMVQPLGLRVVEDMIEARLVGDSERRVKISTLDAHH